jgi:hypothetical protein
LVLPTTIAPASRSRVTTVASLVARWPANAGLPPRRRQRCDVDGLLDGEWQAQQRTGRAGGKRGVRSLGVRQGLVGARDDDGVDERIQALDPPQRRLGQLARGDRPVAQQGGDRGRGAQQ